MNKKVILGISVSLGFVLAAGLGYFLFTEKEYSETLNPVEQGEKIVPDFENQTKISQLAKYIPKVRKANLYNFSEQIIPFSAIADLALLPENVLKTVNDYLNESETGIYFLKHTDDKVLLISGLNNEGEEQALKRHDFNFIEISLHDGSVINHSESENPSKYDKWEYDGDLPLKHTHYNDNKKLIYTEFWTYSEEEPIKYKKTDKDGNVISLRKEVVDNGTNLREEHLFYDKDGNMTQNVSFNYDGIDLTRFTYYNSQTPDDSVMIVSDYEDGVKKKETLYSSDYKIKNTYLPEYKEGQKSELKILDKDNNLVETLVEE